MACRTRGNASPSKQQSTIEFVPKLQLDRAEEEIDRLRRSNQTLKEENDRLRKELEEARRLPAPPNGTFFAAEEETQPPAEWAQGPIRAASFLYPARVYTEIASR